MKKDFVAAVLVASLIGSAGGWAAEPLERLFFTPAQRKSLDAGKYASTQSAPVKPGPKTVRLDGVVTRSDADRTVWINGTAYHGGSPDGVQVKTNPATPASTSIRVPGKTATSRVKVGQQLDLNSGQIREDFSRQPEATESKPPAENPVPPHVIAKKSKTTADEPPPVRETVKPDKKSEGAGSNPGADTPAPAQ